MKSLAGFLFAIAAWPGLAMAQVVPEFSFIVSPLPEKHALHVELKTAGWSADTLLFKMPNWTPGYYQLLNYAHGVENFSGTLDGTNRIVPEKIDENTWRATGVRGRTLLLSYDVKAEKKFVAQSFADNTHLYLVPAGTFVYVPGHLNMPVSVQMNVDNQWSIATGLTTVKGSENLYRAADFDMLYDCPILAGPLEELPSFNVKGVKHRFVAYQPGNFDKVVFMKNLEKVVTAAVNVIGDIPFPEYVFIGIGPGRGGIEHLNNTTVSFEGTGLDKPEAMNRMMNFLAHEYFHHYNVKRIRPFELGPFDYDKGSRTNLLWVSEGLSVYYEYLIVKRAGLIDNETLLSNLGGNINATENNPGRKFQSLAQASFRTWSDGPFGNQGADTGKTISIYDKGPIVGLILDFAIRNATANNKSLDDVMRYLYQHYYKNLQRGFTDAEFEQVCETVAGTRLSEAFEYVYTTKDIDYNKYLNYAGLTLQESQSTKPDTRIFEIRPVPNINSRQSAIFNSWVGGKP